MWNDICMLKIIPWYQYKWDIYFKVRVFSKSAKMYSILMKFSILMISLSDVQTLSLYMLVLWLLNGTGNCWILPYSLKVARKFSGSLSSRRPFSQGYLQCSFQSQIIFFFFLSRPLILLNCSWVRKVLKSGSLKICFY